MSEHHPYFIQSAIKHPGAFTNYCKHKGYSGVTNACIAEGEHSPNSHTEHRARLARTLRHMHHHRGPRTH